MRSQVRHRDAARSSTLRVRKVGGLFPEGANDFRRKCSEYTGPTRWLLPRSAPMPIAHERAAAAFHRIDGAEPPGPGDARCWP